MSDRTSSHSASSTGHGPSVSPSTHDWDRYMRHIVRTHVGPDEPINGIRNWKGTEDLEGQVPRGEATVTVTCCMDPMGPRRTAIEAKDCMTQGKG